ncbi:MAG: alkaline phosphatase D family protein [Gemmataceae bacterium]|nr:alkaline phosphatase D family protein [Gemmataceae bacterium]
MQRIWIGLVAGVLGAHGAASGQEPRAEITHGPILGRLGSREVGVWIRTAQPGKFAVRYGVAANALDQVSMGETRLERDNTGWVHIKGLEPATKYFYRVIGSRREVDGAFRTLPDSAALRDDKLNPRGLFNFSFEFACGNNQNPKQGLGANGPAFKTMLRELHDKIDFAILNGDWLYEDARGHTVNAWLKQVGRTENDAPHNVKIAPTLVGVWENYKVYLERGKNLSEWHRHVPSFFTLDDHEILNDVWGAGQPGIRERRAVFRDIGVRAWHDYLAWSNPAGFTQDIRFGKAELKKGSDILVDPAADFTKLDLQQVANLHVHWGKPSAGENINALDDEPPGDPNAGVFAITEVLDKHRLRIKPPAYADSVSSYSIGRRNYVKMRVANCDFYLLDTRSHRDMHDLDDRGKKGISILGREQKAWLKQEMKSSDADFFFVVSSVNLMVPHVGGGAVRPQNKDDSWTVFLEERGEMIDFWRGLGKPVLVLTGDLHNSFAVRIADNVWEFASGPHNSQNHLVGDEGNRPANGPFDSFGTKCFIRWSSYFANDVPREAARQPLYCVVQVNNVFNNPRAIGGTRWLAFPRPQVIFQYYDGFTGRLQYAETVVAR